MGHWGDVCAEGVFSFAGAQAVYKELARVKADGGWGLNAPQWTVHSWLKGDFEQELEWSVSEF